MKKRFWPGCVLILALLAWGIRRPYARHWGGITHEGLEYVLPLAHPAAGIAQVPFANMPVYIYPTPRTRIGEGRGAWVRNALTLPLEDGSYSHDLNGKPVDFRLYRSQIISLPYAYGNGQAALNFGTLFYGRHTQACVGVVQLLEMRRGKLLLMDQFTYNCMGGGRVTYHPRQRSLHIHSPHYAAGDRLCCPSLDDRAHFSLDGRRAHSGGIKLVQ